VKTFYTIGVDNFHKSSPRGVSNQKPFGGRKRHPRKISKNQQRGKTVPAAKIGLKKI